MGFKFGEKTDKKMTGQLLARESVAKGTMTGLPGTIELTKEPSAGISTRTFRSQKGQSVILVSMMLLSFLMFFGFVVNTGLLVAAKISVQAAADAAAYAGAATQARQLNAISFLNYDMRRQYKKFIYRYAFVGNIGNTNFPKEPEADPAIVAKLGSPIGKPPPKGYYSFWKKDSSSGSTKANRIDVPVVCIPLTTNGKPNDNCLQLNVPTQTDALRNSYPPGSVDAIASALLDNFKKIDDALNTNCTKQGNVNLMVLNAWLFRGINADAAITNMLNLMTTDPSFTDKDKAAAIATVSQLVDGLGLYPRNIISGMRINTLEKFLNQPPAAGVTLDQAKSWENSPQAESYERTILAFKSALSNLNANVMDHNQVMMTELQSANQLSIVPINVNFNAYAQMLVSDNTNLPSGTICNAQVMPMIAVNAPVGVKKADGFAGIVHYAVKVTAKAKLMFLPGKDPTIDLEAFAGAKPFGSRIGPANETAADFTEVIQPSGNINDCSGPAQCLVPNLKLDGTTSFYSTAFLSEVLAIAKGSANTFGFDGLLRGLNQATAPNPVEVGHYNILPPAKPTAGSAGDPLADMRYEMIPYSSDASYTADSKRGGAIYRFYAPLYPAGENNSADTINQFLDAMFAHTSVGKNSMGFNPADLRLEIYKTMTDYINGNLTNGSGAEYNESLTFAAVQLPIQLGAPFATVPSASNLWLNQANQVLSSWAPDQARLSDSAYGLMPRFGYSVKFVTLQDLVAGGMPASDGDLTKVNH